MPYRKNVSKRSRFMYGVGCSFRCSPANRALGVKGFSGIQAFGQSADGDVPASDESIAVSGGDAEAQTYNDYLVSQHDNSVGSGDAEAAVAASYGVNVKNYTQPAVATTKASPFTDALVAFTKTAGQYANSRLQTSLGVQQPAPKPVVQSSMSAGNVAVIGLLAVGAVFLATR